MLKGNVALITGGSRGIGAAIAKKYAALGADIAIVYAGNAQAGDHHTSCVIHQKFSFTLPGRRPPGGPPR